MIFVVPLLQKAKSLRTVPKKITVKRNGKLFQTIVYVLPGEAEKPDAGNYGLDFGEDYRKNLVSAEVAGVEKRRDSEIKKLDQWLSRKLQTTKSEELRAAHVERHKSAVEELTRQYEAKIADLKGLDYQEHQEPRKKPRKLDPLTAKARKWAAKMADLYRAKKEHGARKIADLKGIFPYSELGAAMAEDGMDFLYMGPAQIGEDDYAIRFYDALASGEIGYRTTIIGGAESGEKWIKPDAASDGPIERIHQWAAMPRETVDDRQIASVMKSALFKKGMLLSSRDEQKIVEGKEPVMIRADGKKILVPPRNLVSNDTFYRVDTPDPVEAVKKMVSQGVSTVNDCLAVGEVIYREVVGKENKELIQLTTEAESLIKDMDSNRRARKKEWRRGYSDTYRVLSEEYDKMIARINENRAKAATLMKDLDAKNSGGKIMDFLRQIRPMGPGGNDTILKDNTGGWSKQAKDALEVFPTDWLQNTKAINLSHMKDQGRWKAATRTAFAPWGEDNPRALNTQAHELGHAVEDFNPGVQKLCREFVASLVDGSHMKRDSRTMRAWQSGVVSSDLPSKYCGVIYDDLGSTEVLSMACGDIFKDYESRLHTGEKYWKFVLGLMAGVKAG